VNNRVKAALVLNGIKQIEIARRLHLTAGTVSAVIAGKRQSARIQRAIARALGTTIEELWPNGHNNNHGKAA